MYESSIANLASRITVFRTLALLLLALLLSGCPAPPVLIDDTRSRLESSIQALAQQGRYAEAAQAWLDAAAKAQPPEQQRYQYEAAQALVQAEDIDAAVAILESIDLLLASDETALSTRLYLAERAFVNNNFQQVIQWLPLTLKLASQQRQQRIYALQADALERLGETIEAAQQRILLDTLLAVDLRASNQQRLWTLLFRSPVAKLNSALEDENLRGSNSSFAGWISLAKLFKQHGLDTTLLQSASIDWQSQYPAHPANQGLLQRQLALFSSPLPNPKKIHVLLPLSGKFAKVGKAIQDGLLLALYGGDTRPEVRFVDTVGGDPYALYQAAVEAGANAVVGPVLKSSIKKILRGENLSVPLLALNKVSVDERLPDNVYQFGLAPEDDAVNAAQYALMNDWRGALLLVPDSNWGKRIRDSFATQYRLGGGLVLNDQLLPAKMTDLAQPMKRVLGLDNSEQRQKALNKLLGIRLEFEPRKRGDASVVFVAANARQVRVVRPLLKFLHAGELPVIATSHAYQGSSDAVRDRDLEKLMFTDIPWVIGAGRYAALRTRADDLWPRASQRLPRLFALGYDAYSLLPYLHRLKATSPQSLPGATGELFSDEQGVIHRKTLWAKFNGGVPRLLEPVVVSKTF